MTAIFTKTIPCTKTKPTRIKSWAANNKTGKVIFSKSKLENEISFGGDATEDQIHELAARKFAEFMRWDGKFVQGGTNEGFVFVFAN